MNPIGRHRQAGDLFALPLLVALLAGCSKVDSHQPPSANRSKLGKILADLGSDKPADRQRAADRLEEWSQEELTANDSRQLLRAAAENWPADEERDTSDALVAAALTVDRGYWDSVVEHFPRFSKAARRRVVQHLVDHPGSSTARTYLDLVGRYSANAVVPDVSLEGFAASPEAGKILFPKLLKYAGPHDLGFQIELYTLQSLQAGRLTKADVARLADSVLPTLATLRQRMRSLEQPENDDWIWGEEYSGDRAHATLLLDLLGYLDGEGVAEALSEALTSRDPRVLYFAALSSLRHGQEPPQAVVDNVAASPEMRNWFHKSLGELNRLELFPVQFASQETLAEANLVEWLVYPTELGRTPHEIELMQTFEDEDREERYYLFRFRTHAPHWAADEGWMVGIAGPFEIAAMPTTSAGGSTFSDFAHWDEKSPEEHFKTITGLIAEQWKRRAAEIESGDGE